MGEHEKAAGQGICLGGGGVRVRSEQPGARRGPGWGWKNVLGDQCVVLRTAVPLTLAAGGCVSLAIHKIIVSSNLRNQKPFGGPQSLDTVRTLTGAEQLSVSCHVSADCSVLPR